MAPLDFTPMASVVLSLLVSAVALLLMLRQWSEHRDRGDDLSGADRDHFSRQDARRFLGSVVMVLIAVGLLVGSQMIYQLNFRERLNRRLLAGVWAAVFLLTFLLLVLAWRDMKATRAYARRHRRAIAEERREFLEAEQRRRSITGNGRGGPHSLGDFPTP